MAGDNLTAGQRKVTIEVEVETPNGKETIRLARPDLLDMDEINARQEEWQKLTKKAKEGITPPGLFKDINEFLSRYVPALSLTHTIGVIDGGEIPEADFYIVTSREVKLTPAIVTKRLDAVALMAMFTGIMKSTAAIGTAVEEGADLSAEFRGPPVRGRGGAPGKARKPTPK